jgi:hypothetical protein
MIRRNLSLGKKLQNIITVITIFALPHHLLIRYFIIMSLLCNFHPTTQCRFSKMFFVEHRAAHAYVCIPIVCLYMYCRWIPSYQEVSWDHINWLTRNFCVQEPSQDIDFQRHMSWSPIVVSVSWSERWLFILLIIVECHTKIVLTFFS